MATRKNQTSSIDPIAVIALGLKRVKVKTDYNRIVDANNYMDLEAAWASLSASEQSRIHQICDEAPEADLKAIADELITCGTLLELRGMKSEHGEYAVKAAWKLIPSEEKMRLKGICQTEEKLTGETPQVMEETQPKTRTLFSIGTDLEKLNELLDEAGDDTQQQELLNQWLENLGTERDRKLDGYAALITEMLARAEVRKNEAKRLQELATTDENRAKLLKDRLKTFFETHNLKTIETSRYRLSLAKNGGKAPLILKDGISPIDLPECFQKVSIDADTAAIRAVLEAGEVLEFAALGDRGTSMRIK